MVEFFSHIYDWLIQRRWMAWTILIAVLSGCLWLATKIGYEEDIAAFLPNDPATADYSSVYTNMGGQDKIAVVFHGEMESLPEAMDEFGDMLAEADTASLVKDMMVTVDEEQMLDAMNFIWQNYPAMLSDADLQRIDTLLSTPDFIEKQLQENHRLMMLPLSSIMTQSMPYDPLHLSAPITSGLRNSNVSSNYQIVDGHIFSRDGDRGIVLLSSPFGVSESGQNERLSELIEAVSDSVMAHHQDVTVSAIGAPLIAVTNASQIKKDSFLAVGLAVLLIFAVLIYSFHRFSDILWMGISIATGWIFALGCTALLSSSISIIVLGIGSVIIGIAVNYPIHFLDHLKHESDKRAALREMVPPLLIGNITTVSAFLCLVFLDADAMNDLGMFGSLMLIGTILFVLILLPVLVPERKAGGPTHPLIPARDFTIPSYIKRPMLPLLVILTIVFGVLSLNTSFDSNMQHINYMTPEQRENMQFLFSSVESDDNTQTIFAVAQGKDMDEALQHNEKLVAQLEGREGIEGVSGVGNIFPSSAKKAERLQQWQKLWAHHSGTVDSLRILSRQAGFTPTAFQPFYDAVSQSDNIAIKVDDYEPVMNLIAANFVQKTEQGIRLVNIIKVAKDKASDTKAQLRSELTDGSFVFDASDVSSNLVNILSDSFNYIGFVCGFVVFFFLWVSFGRLELSLLAFLPLAVSWLWILGIMDLFGMQFNIVNIILATFIFGQGDDYTIFITEGLMYEHAYGRKRLATYKNSVMLSAVLMFIGIGTLIFAKHPAMRSLAEVAIIGMFTVVIMAYYLPPLVFRWITTKNGKPREVPLTIPRILRSLWAIIFFLLCCFLVFIPYTLIYRCTGHMTEAKRLRFHRVLQIAADFVIHRVPGTHFRLINEVKEKFDRPSVIICNHQSHLDVMCLMMLTPKVVILTNDWVWNNPFYGLIIHTAEFYPTSDGMDKNVDRLKDLTSRGYSVVVFPEGTRTTRRGILRFHQGAFALAKALNVDILPIMIHGLTDVLPKWDFMLRQADITVEVCKRMSAEEVQSQDTLELTRNWHHWYLEQYERLSRQVETIEYVTPYVQYKYLYKGMGIERECKKQLRQLASQWQDVEAEIASSVTVDGDGRNILRLDNCGIGIKAWAIALVHPDIEVYASENDEEKFLIAQNTSHQPENLHFIKSEKEK